MKSKKAKATNRVSEAEVIDACSLMLALAVIDEPSSDMWLEFVSGHGKSLSNEKVEMAKIYAEAIIDLLITMNKHSTLVLENIVVKNSKAKNKGVSK